MVQPFWQQKHPTPSSATWEFHWHPRGLDAAVTQAVAAMDVTLAGGAGFLVGPSHLVWLRTFNAVSASEQRGYVGVAGVWARPAPGDDAVWSDAVPALLGALELPAAAPFSGGDAARTVSVRQLPAGPVALGGLDAEALAHAVVAGGRVGVPDPDDAALPALVGRLLAWLPAEARTRERRVAFVADTRSDAGLGEDPIVHYLARAWSLGDPAAWKLVAAACAASGRGLAELFRDLTALSAAWDSGEELGRWLRASVLVEGELERCDASAPAPLLADPGDAGLVWNRVLHYWGRGFLRGDGITGRLARVLAGRVLVDHLVGLDDTAAEPLRYLRRLRTEALLPAARAAEMSREVARELPGIQP